MAKIFYDSLNHKPQMEKFLEAKKVNFHSEGNLEPYAVGYRFFCSVYDHTRSIDKIFKIVRHPDISREEIRDPGIYLARI